MDSKKRRNSILKKFSETDTSVEFETKLKRRISFSGKKSVRVFCLEEETKTYNNSYEESDNTANTSEESKHCGTHQLVKQAHNELSNCNEISKISQHKVQLQIPQTKTNIVDKENIYSGNNQSISSSKSLGQKIPQINRCSILSDKVGSKVLPISLHTTMDFINNSQINEPFRIENSIDISLLEQEHTLKAAIKKKANSARLSSSQIYSGDMSSQNETAEPLMSFSLEEHERDVLQKAKAGNYEFTDLSFFNSTKVAEDTNKKSMNASKIVYTDHSSDYKENMNPERNGNQTVGSLKGQKESISDKVKLAKTIFYQSTYVDEDYTFSIPRLKRNTIFRSQNMELEQCAQIESSQSVSQNVRENFASKTLITDCTMEIEQDHNNQKGTFNIETEAELNESPKLHEKTNKYSSIEPTIQIPMDLSMNCLDGQIPIENIENDSTKNVRRTIHFKDKSNTLGQDLEMSLVDSAISHTSNVKEHRKSIVFGDNESSELDISKRVFQEGNNKKTVNDLNGEHIEDMEVVTEPQRVTKNIAVPNVLSDLEMSKHTFGESNELLNNKSIYDQNRNLDDMEVDHFSEFRPLKVYSSTMSVINKKGAVPKVVVVRKTCNSKVNQEIVGDLHRQRFERYQNKLKRDENVSKETKECSSKFIEKAKTDDNLFPNSESMLLSPEFTSPIYPPICVGGKTKKYNFRQLNEELENGNIKLFQDTLQTPRNKSNKFRNQPISYNHDEIEHDKSLETIFYKSVDKSNNSKFQHGILDKTKNEVKDKLFLFSEADDIQLDDTVFLTQAKLGDETVSRNSTKCSISKTDINPNGENDMTLECSNHNVNRDMEKSLPTFHETNFTYLETKDISTEQVKALKENAEQDKEYKSNAANKNLDVSANKTIIFEEENEMECDVSKAADENNSNNLKKSYASILRNKEDSNPIMKGDENITAKRQTVYYKKECEIDLDHSLRANLANQESNICITRKNRQTLHLTENNDLDQSTIANPAKVESNDTPNNDIFITRKKRQTLHFTGNNDLELDESISGNVRAECSQSVETLNCAKGNEIELEKTTFGKRIIKRTETPKVMNFQNSLNAAKLALNRKSVNKSAKVGNSLDDSLLAKLKEVRESTFKNDRKTIYCDNSMDLADSPARNTREQEDNLRRLYEGTPHRSVIEFEFLEMEAKKDLENSQIMDTSILPQEINNHINKSVDIEQTDFGLTSKPKIDVHRKINFGNEDMPITLTENSVKRNHRRQTNYESTDIALEESGLQSIDTCNDMDDSKLMSPKIHVSDQENINKRSTIHLTPIFSTSKKRNTLFFNNCDLEESIVHKSEPKYLEKLEDSKYPMEDENQVINMEVTIDYNTNDCVEITKDVSVLKSQKASETITTAQCENILIDSEEDNQRQMSIAETNLQSSPARSSISRIPIHLESAKKNNSIVSRFLSPRTGNEDNLDHSLETIELPRRATTLKCRESHVPLVNSLIERKELFEDNPITISDVSVFYMSQRHKRETSGNENINDNYCNQSVDQEIVSARKLSTDICDDTTVNNIAKFRKRYIDLTCESPELTCGLDDIDMTRLSLVDTVLDDDEEDENVSPVDNTKTVIPNNEPITKVQKRSRLSIADLKNNSIMCRKCKRCQESFLNDTASTADSFILPEMPPIPDLGMKRLNRLRSKPTIIEVDEYWLRMNFNQDIIIENLSFDNIYLEEDDEDEEDDEIDIFVTEYKDKLKRTEREISELFSSKSNTRIRSFVSRLDERLISTLPNWIFDYQMQELNLYRFDHEKLKTFTIVLYYIEKDPMGNNIEIKDIQLQASNFETNNWKPIDFILDFQLKLELPFDLGSYFQPNDIDGVYEMLKQVDQLCNGVEDLGCKFLRVVYNAKATVVREANASFVKKIVRKIIPRGEVPYSRVNKLEFKIGITNIRKICYKDIVSPPLHMFREDVQYMPTGIDFLCAFLANPELHLKI